MPISPEMFTIQIGIPRGALADKLEELAARFPGGPIPMDALTAMLAEQVTTASVNIAVASAAAELAGLWTTHSNVVERLRGGHF